jgi:adenine-specific DNA-methyltransferase
VIRLPRQDLEQCVIAFGKQWERVMATGIPRPRQQETAAHNGRLSPPAITGGAGVELAYPGKQPEAQILKSARAALVPLHRRTVTPLALMGIRRLYYADNLGVLAALLADKSVQGHVKLVYIDPPFATRSTFQSRAQKDAYDDLLAGSHYLEFLRQRLILLREILAEDGSIYVHLVPDHGPCCT